MCGSIGIAQIVAQEWTVNDMDEQNKCVMPDYEAECKRLYAKYHEEKELNQKMSDEIRGMKDYFENRERDHYQEAAILKAKLEMVYLIFGGRNYG
jgi:hypothetical protein